MFRKCYFGDFKGDYWPRAEQLAPYFFSNPPWAFKGGNDSWGLDAFGLCGTEALPEADRVNVYFFVSGRSDAGINLTYRKWDGRVQDAFYWHSKGRPERLREFVKTGHGDLLSAGLFIPFDAGFRAVKQFIERDGELPDVIEWVTPGELPRGTFPDLGDRAAIAKLKAEGRII